MASFNIINEHTAKAKEVREVKYNYSPDNIFVLQRAESSNFPHEHFHT